MAYSRERGLTPNEHTIGTSSGKELLFSRSNVTEMIKALGPITYSDKHRGWVLKFQERGHLVFGGDRGPDGEQRTSVYYFFDQGDLGSDNVHMGQISRVARDPENPEAIQFIKEGSKGNTVFTVFRDGTANFQTFKK